MNRLGQEKSPYLLQHKDNPVHWYTWGEDAFEAAKKENKIIFLSIGYSTCHWCHVMGKDSFENREIADILNKHFISIKVDREERPDVDQIYMDAVQAITGSGGWPLSVFLTPDLKPFFGGNFFWKEQFIVLLNQIQQTWESEKDKIISSGEQVVTFLNKGIEETEVFKLDTDAIIQAFTTFRNGFDEKYGGFGKAPKFPKSIDLSVLLRIYRRTGNENALKMVTTTLDNMARGGIYDHIGGGFHRYSTDDQWLIPHFEKMLCDNALLAWTYLEAYQVTGNDMYKDVAKETLDYILRDMTHPEGGFYSAEDADSEGEEGKFYVWTWEELKKLFKKKELDLVSDIYGISKEGNFKDEINILHLKEENSRDIKKDPQIQKIHRKLFETREKRIHPHKDDKILTSWNGLMIAGMSKTYRVLGDERYLKAAVDAAHFIRKNLYRDEKLVRRYRDGESRHDGYLNDYSHMIFGLINLYESNFDSQWLNWARELSEKQDELFRDEDKGGYFFSEKEAENLIVRNKQLSDEEIPSGNSIAALNLLHLFALTYETDYLKKAEKIFEAVSTPFSRYPPGYASVLLALDYYLDRSKEIAVIGKPDADETRTIKKFLYENFLPNITYVFSTPDEKKDLPLLKDRKAIDGKTTVYVCENNICKKPTTDIEEAKKMIGEFEKYEL